LAGFVIASDQYACNFRFRFVGFTDHLIEVDRLGHVDAAFDGGARRDRV
jgi:hypothetical protein